MTGHQAAVRFKSKNQGVDEDDSDDEMLDAAGFDPFGQADPPRLNVPAVF